MKFDFAFPVEFLQKNREKLRRTLPPRSLAIVVSNARAHRTADLFYPFHPNPNILYLTGIDQPETALVLCPDHPDADMREVLFIKKPSETYLTWEGRLLDPDQAKELSGIETVRWFDELFTLLPKWMWFAHYVYVDVNEHERYLPTACDYSRMLVHRLQELYPLHEFKRLALVMNALRSVKEHHELEWIKKAIEITGEVFTEVCQNLSKLRKENEVEALIVSGLRRRGAYPAFETIVAAGINACILHYSDNNAPLVRGEVLLLDFGACWNWYNADVTRIVPIGGKFSKRARQIYDAVLRVLTRTKENLKAGIYPSEYYDMVARFVGEELMELGLLTSEQLASEQWKTHVSKYFPHRAGHYLGLDVHDVGMRNEALQPGMVITIEPGIYIREEAIGIRLENDVLITANGCQDLCENIPIEPDQIEALLS